MGRGVAKGLIGLGLVLVALVVGADTALRFTRTDDWLANRLIGFAPEAVRDISFTGPIEFRLLPRPRVAATGVSLRNNRGEALLSAQAASLDISLWALARGVLEFSPVILRGLSITIAIDKDGRSNWDMPSGGAHHQAPPKGDLFIEDATVSFRDDRWKGLSFAATNGNFEVSIAESYASYLLAGAMTIDGAQAGINLALDRTKGSAYAAKLSVALPGAGFDLRGTLSELSPVARIDGQVDAHVDSLLSFMERIEGPIDTVNLSPALLGSFVLSSPIRLSRQGLALPKAAFTIVPTRHGEKLARVEGTAELEADFSRRQPTIDAAIHLGTLDFRHFMAEKSNWAGLARLAAHLSLAAIDGMPEQGEANVALEIAHGGYNDRSIENMHFGLGLKGSVGNIESWARLPGDAPIFFSGQVSGGKGARRLAGSFGVRGERPAETLHWLLPKALPAPEGDAPTSPFAIEARLSPATATTPHNVHADIDLNGIKGAADIGVDIAPQMKLDAHLAIETLDLLRYVRAGRQLGLDSLGLSGIELQAQGSIDTHQPSLPLATEHAAITVQQVDARLAPLPARPAEKPTPPTAHGTPLHAIGQWLAALPKKVDASVHPGPAQSLIEAGFPSFKANLSDIEAWLYHLNFREPVKLSAERIVVRDGNGVPAYRRRDGVAESVALTLVAYDTPGAAKTSTVAADLSLGAVTGSDVRLSSGSLVLEADLDRTGPRLVALRLAKLHLAGDVDDMVNPTALPGVLGSAGPFRRLPFAFKASGTADPGHAALKVDHATLGDLGQLDGVRLEASQSQAGLLKVDISNAGDKTRERAAVQATCTLRPALSGGTHVLDFKIDLTGSGPPLDATYGLIDGAALSEAPRRPLLRAVSAHGFATREASVIEELELRLGDASVVAAKLAAAADKRGTVSAEGCVDAALQTKPRLASIGWSGQELALPLLTAPWQSESTGKRDEAGLMGARFDGQITLLEDGIISDGPLRLSLRRQGTGIDSFDVELDRLQLHLPTEAKASPLRLALAGFRFADKSGEFNLASATAGQAPMLVLQQAPPGRRGCEGKPDMQAELRLGIVDHVDIAALKRFASRVSGLMRGGGRPSPCDPLHVRLTATELHSWPDLVSTFTESKPMRDAAQHAPALRDLNLSLTIDKAHALSYTLDTGVRSTQAVTAPCASRERLQSNGSFAVAKDRWRGEMHGVVTCLDLGEALSIAEVASGRPIRATGLSLRNGHLDRLSLDLAVTPDNATDWLSRLSGAIGWEGTVALNIEGSKLQTGVQIYNLQEEQKRGFRMKGHIEMAARTVTGSLAVRDPRLDNNAYYGRADAEKWPDAIGMTGRGSLLKKTIDAEVTIRSPEWRPPERDLACVGAGGRDRLQTFPSWAEKMSICIPLAKGAECAKPVRRPLTVADYPCGAAAR